MDLDRTTVDQLLTTTRAVRRRLDLTRTVPKDVIVECLHLATQAPTAGNAQTWRWVIVTDPRVRKQVADLYRSLNEPIVDGQLAAARESRERRRLESVRYLIDHLHEVPVHTLAFILDESIESAPVPAAVLYGSIFPAIWSFQLALRSRGLGTTPLYVADEASVAHAMNAPPSARLASLLPVAYYRGTEFKPASRRPLEDVLFWNRWDNSKAPRTGAD